MPQRGDEAGDGGGGGGDGHADDQPAGKDDLDRRLGNDLHRDELGSRRRVSGTFGRQSVGAFSTAGVEGGLADPAGGAEGPDRLAGLPPGGDGVPPELLAGFVT